MGRRAQFHIEAGDLFVRCDLPQVVWRAIRAVPTPEGIKHVLLERQDDPDTRKLLSYSVLSDRRTFRRAGHEAATAPSPATLFELSPPATIKEPT